MSVPLGDGLLLLSCSTTAAALQQAGASCLDVRPVLHLCCICMVKLWCV